MEKHKKDIEVFSIKGKSALRYLEKYLSEQALKDYNKYRKKVIGVIA